MSGSIFSQAFRTATLTLITSTAVALGPNLAQAASTNAYQVKVPTSFEYNTAGVIRTNAAAAKTVHGPNQLTFDGVSRGSYVTDSSQPIQLGQFVVHPATTANGSAAVTTYNHTPFVIQIHAPSYDKTSKIPILANVLPNFGRTFHLQNQTLNSLLVRGHLDGTVNTASNSSVTATVDSVKLGSLAVPDKKYATSYTFPVRSTDLRLPTSWTMNTAGATSGLASSTATGTNLAAPTPAGGSVSAAQILANPAAETLTASATSSTNLAAGSVAPSPAAETLTAGSTNLASPTPTPEPTTALIFAAGLGAIAFARRRSKS